MLEKLCVKGEAGIPHDPLNTKTRQNMFGSNVYKEKPPKSLWSLITDEFEDQVLQLLMFAALISTVLGVAVEEQRQERNLSITLRWFITLLILVTHAR